jgi:SAM-dependent methyltransferase
MDLILEKIKCMCGEDKTNPIVTIHLKNGSEARIVECQSCGLRYLNPRPNKEFLTWMYKEEYYASVIDDRDEWEKKTHLHELLRERIHLYRLKPILKMKDLHGFRRLLDIGTGAGYFLKLAKDKGFDPIGIEVSKRASEFAKKNYNIRVLNISGLENAGFEDGSFDVVTLSHVIEHLPSPEDTLKEIYRILQDNGILLIVTPNCRTVATSLSTLNRRLGYPVRRLEDDYTVKTWENGWHHLRPKRMDDKGYMMYLLHNFHHLYFFNHKTLKDLLCRCNFSIEVYPVGGYDCGMRGIRKPFSNRPINLLSRIFNLQAEIMYYARKS